MKKIVWCAVLLGLGCGPKPPSGPTWSTVFQALPGALISVSGTSAHDVWSVGGDPGDGSGPFVLHYDGTGWKKLIPGIQGDLWWVQAFENGPVFMGGANGTVLKYENGTFTKMVTPPETTTVFGIWGVSPTDLWAVGGDGNAHGFAWHYDGTTWSIPAGLPADLSTMSSLYKVWGTATNDVWFVGSSTRAMHYDGKTFTDTTPAALVSSESPLFTVHGSNGHVVAVGGFASGVVLGNDNAEWKDESPHGIMPLSGVFLSGDDGYAVGGHGTVRRRAGGTWAKEDTGLTITDGLHAVWMDPDGGVWAVGGQVSDIPLVHGIMIHKGAAVAGGTFTQ